VVAAEEEEEAAAAPLLVPPIAPLAPQIISESTGRTIIKLFTLSFVAYLKTSAN